METKIRFISTVVTLILISLLVSGEVVSNAQSKSSAVENVSFSVLNENIIITYDLKGSVNQLYEIKLILRKTSYSDFMYIPQSITGNVGKGQTAGTNKRIIWDIKKDFPEELPGEDFFFEVQVQEINEDSDIFTWVGIGIAAVAAVGAYIFISGNSSDETNGSNSGFPPPPGRP
jgi:hypothetical protein